MSVAYDVIFSVIAGLPKLYPNFSDAPHSVLQLCEEKLEAPLVHTGTSLAYSLYRMTPDNFYCDHPCCHGNEIWDKIGHTSAYMRDIAEIFSHNSVFRGRANARCHWDKIGYNSAYIRDIRETFVYNRRFSESGYWMTPDKFHRDQPRCHGNEIWDTIGYNSAFIRGN